MIEQTTMSFKIPCKGELTPARFSLNYTGSTLLELQKSGGRKPQLRFFVSFTQKYPEEQNCMKAYNNVSVADA